MKRFGEKLRTLREKQGLSIRQLASLLEITSHSHIVNLEAGRKRPSIAIILKACALFNVTPNQLMLDDEEVAQ
jgi:transcriptional regulator with XRE-family HTH domain